MYRSLVSIGPSVLITSGVCFNCPSTCSSESSSISDTDGLSAMTPPFARSIIMPTRRPLGAHLLKNPHICAHSSEGRCDGINQRQRVVQPSRQSAARHGCRPGWSGTKAGAQARPGVGPRAGSGASRLDPVQEVVTHSVMQDLKRCAQAGSSVVCRCARARNRTGRMVHVMRTSACVMVTVHGSERRRALRV